MEQPDASAGLSERPTLPWRPEPPSVDPPSIAPPADSTPPPPTLSFGPVMAAVGAIAFGVVVATAVAPRVAGLVSEPPEEVTPTESPPVASAAPAAVSVASSPAPEAPSVAQPPAPTEATTLAGVRPPSVEGPSPADIRPVDVPEPTGAEPREVGLRPVAVRARMIEAPRVREQRIRPRRAEGPPPATTELSAADIRAVVGPQSARMRQCYTTALRRSGEARDARARVWVRIDPEGYVNEVRVSGDDLGGMRECLRRTAIRWRFPRSRSGGEVPVPLSFTAVR